jgi:hypothetical protein
VTGAGEAPACWHWPVTDQERRRTVEAEHAVPDWKPADRASSRVLWLNVFLVLLTAALVALTVGAGFQVGPTSMAAF